MPKILLVEDNEMNRDMLSRRLVRRGFDVIVAVDGESGVVTAQTELPDLIVMDMSLPILDLSTCYGRRSRERYGSWL